MYFDGEIWRIYGPSAYYSKHKTLTRAICEALVLIALEKKWWVSAEIGAGFIIRTLAIQTVPSGKFVASVNYLKVNVNANKNRGTTCNQSSKNYKKS